MLQRMGQRFALDLYSPDYMGKSTYYWKVIVFWENALSHIVWRIKVAEGPHALQSGKVGVNRRFSAYFGG